VSDLEIHAPDADGLALLTYLAVQAQLLKLKLQTALLAGAIGRERRAMEADAAAARQVAEMSGPADVAPEFIAKINEVAAALLGVSKAAGVVVSAADGASLAADETNGSHRGEYGGIYDLSKTGRHPMAKPGFYETK